MMAELALGERWSLAIIAMISCAVLFHALHVGAAIPMNERIATAMTDGRKVIVGL